MPRPERLVLVVGTGTEVGKTWVACALARALRAAGVEVAARKPAQSFDPADPGPTDAELLAVATGEKAGEVCRPELTYPVPMAPPMAAAALGRPAPTMAELVGGLADGPAWGDGLGVGIVEAAGGVRSPLADDGDSVDLARAIRPDLVVLVADAGLGTIHAVRSAAPALADWPLAVVLNRYDAGSDLHRRNRAWLAERDRLPVYTDVAAVLGDLLARDSR
ncbi:MAG TPA: dethiobiotin synthase [Acidimicrobiales bacterium]|nr:dethiobiotin synthase [Acidimicrobiales bacterium]